MTGKDDPFTFYPTREAALTPEEWQNYDFDQAQEGEAWKQDATWARSMSKDSASDYVPWWFTAGVQQPQPQVPVGEPKGVSTGGVPTTSARPGPVGAGGHKPSATAETIAKSFGQLRIENEQLPKTLTLTHEKETKEAKKDPAPKSVLALPNAQDPYQSGSGGFMMLDDVQARREQGRDYLVPQYRKTSNLPIGNLQTNYLEIQAIWRQALWTCDRI